jgi:hypothetical protein
VTKLSVRLPVQVTVTRCKDETETRHHNKERTPFPVSDPGDPYCNIDPAHFPTRVRLSELVLKMSRAAIYASTIRLSRLWAQYCRLRAAYHYGTSTSNSSGGPGPDRGEDITMIHLLAAVGAWETHCLSLLCYSWLGAPCGESIPVHQLPHFRGADSHSLSRHL